MFQTIQQGSNVWVMDKSALTLQMGTVVSTSIPMQWMSPVQGQVMDIVVKTDDGNQNKFTQVNPTMVVAQYGNVIVAETQEAMAREIENLDRQSQQAIESVQFHTKARSAYEEMKRKLSPSYAKEKQNDQRLSALESNQAQMADGINAIKKMLESMGGNDSSNKQK